MRNKKYEDTMKVLALCYAGMLITLILAVLWS